MVISFPYAIINATAVLSLVALSEAVADAHRCACRGGRPTWGARPILLGIMMAKKDVSNPYGFTLDDFAPMGSIDLSAEVMKQAREFLGDLIAFDSQSEWIPAFAWCYSRTFRRSTQVEAIDEGPGIDLAGYRYSELPPGAVETRNGLKIAFIIPREKIQIASAKRIIETRLSSGRLSFELI